VRHCRHAFTPSAGIYVAPAEDALVTAYAVARLEGGVVVSMRSVAVLAHTHTLSRALYSQVLWDRRQEAGQPYYALCGSVRVHYLPGLGH
jgi:hypothetical protein